MSDQDIFASLKSADAEIVEIIAVPFLETIGNERDCLSQASEKSDFKALVAVAHSLKGVVGHFGMHSLEKLFAEIERNARAGVGSPDKVAEAIVILNALERAVRRFVAGA